MSYHSRHAEAVGAFVRGERVEEGAVAPPEAVTDSIWRIVGVAQLD